MRNKIETIRVIRATRAEKKPENYNPKAATHVANVNEVKAPAEFTAIEDTILIEKATTFGGSIRSWADIAKIEGSLVGLGVSTSYVKPKIPTKSRASKEMICFNKTENKKIQRVTVVKIRETKNEKVAVKSSIELDPAIVLVNGEFAQPTASNADEQIAFKESPVSTPIVLNALNVITKKLLTNNLEVKNTKLLGKIDVNKSPKGGDKSASTFNPTKEILKRISSSRLNVNIATKLIERALLLKPPGKKVDAKKEGIKIVTLNELNQGTTISSTIGVKNQKVVSEYNSHSRSSSIQRSSSVVMTSALKNEKEVRSVSSNDVSTKKIKESTPKLKADSGYNSKADVRKIKTKTQIEKLKQCHNESVNVESFNTSSLLRMQEKYHQKLVAKQDKERTENIEKSKRTVDDIASITQRIKDVHAEIKVLEDDAWERDQAQYHYFFDLAKMDYFSETTLGPEERIRLTSPGRIYAKEYKMPLLWTFEMRDFNTEDFRNSGLSLRELRCDMAERKEIFVDALDERDDQIRMKKEIEAVEKAYFSIENEKGKLCE